MSKIEVDAIDKQSGSTLTLGGSGTAVTLACGATQSGFGATGGISWQTAIKAGDFTAVSGEGYFVNTSGGSNITVTLPSSPSAGNVVAIKDYARTFGTNKVIMARNGSNMDGSANNTDLATNGLSVTFVFMDATKGWSLINDDTTSAAGAAFVAATGGTITTVCTNFKVHTFTGPGTFCVSNAGNSGGSNEISYVVVAGGAGGSANGGGGGGAGGYREGKSPQDSYTSSPLACTSGSNNGLPVAVAAYPVTVGGGGPTGPSSGRSTDGTNSVFAGTTTITSTGGGGSGSYCGSAAYDSPTAKGNPGGSGGGGGNGPSTTPGGLPAVPADNKGVGNTPPVSPSQGNPGGRGLHNPGYVPTGAVAGGGGGGAACAGGEPVLTPVGKAGIGGDGTPTQITGSAVTYAGGGGGGIGPSTSFLIASGGAGGGGAGGRYPGTDAIAGTTNTGGGGGGGGHQPQAGQNGGSGIVIIRYKFQ